MEDYTPVIIGILFILLNLILYLIYKRAKSTRKSILITGICDSGKTLVFSRLIHGQDVQTFTSIKENVAPFSINNSVLRVVDIPGHERLRNKFFEEYKNTAKAVVFVVDSLTLQKDIKDVAEYLYNILSDDVISSNKTKLLILCNKQDQDLAKGESAVKSILEKELNTLRVTKSRQLDSVDQKSGIKKMLGDKDKNFTFSSLNFAVEFAEVYAKNDDGDSDLNPLVKWISKIA